MTATIAAGLLAARGAAAQKRVTIYFTHRELAASELHYRLPGDASDQRRGGLAPGDRITVPTGSTVCFFVDRANPLLYTYSAASKAIAVPTPEGLAAVLAAAQGLATSAAMAPAALAAPTTVPRSGARRSLTDSIAALDAALQSVTSQYDSARRRLEDLRNYAARLADALARLSELEALKPASDQRDDFGEVFRDAGRARAEVDKALAAATSAYEDALKAYPDDVVIKQLHLMQDVAVQRKTSVYEEFVQANARLESQDLCTRVESERLRFVLSVASRREKSATPARVVKDTVAVVELEPQSDIAFEVAPGMLLGPSLRRPTFSLRNGVVAVDSTENPLVRPALFALGRLWPLGWLWAGIGAAKGKEATPDLFFGVVARPGLSLVGTQLSVGAGLGLFQVPVALKGGGRVGEALPKDVGDVDKLVDRQYRSGLAITFNITGLEFGETKKK